MTRDLDSAIVTASVAETILPVSFVKLEFDSGDVLLHTRLGNITWGGDTYTGAGTIGGISSVGEDAELSRSNLQLQLSGVTAEIVALALTEHCQGRTATVYQDYLNITTRQLVSDPAIVFRGRMDTWQVEQGQTFTVTLNVENRFAAWDRALTRRHNDADQQARFSGDAGFQYVEQSTDKQINWGQANAV